MRLEKAEIDIMFITKGESVEYINESADRMFDDKGDYDGRVVKIIYTSQTSSSELSVFVAFDESESFTLFTMREGFDMRLNYVDSAVYQYLGQVSPPILSRTERYNTQYEYTYSLSKQAKYGYIMVNSTGTKAYKININQKLIKYTGEWSIREIEEWE